MAPVRDEFISRLGPHSCGGKTLIDTIERALVKPTCLDQFAACSHSSETDLGREHSFLD